MNNVVLNSIGRIIKIFLCRGLFCFLLLNPHYTWAYKPARILVLHSYRPYYSWTQNINAGITGILSGSDFYIDTKIEYMDVLKENDTQHMSLLLKLYQIKYPSDLFDCVIATDNYALDFLIINRPQLFKDTPIVFCGINNYTDSMLSGYENVTGIIENVDVPETLKLIFKLHRKINKIVLWSVVHENSEKNRALAVSLIQRHDPDIKIVHFRDITLKQGLLEIKDLNRDDIIVLLSVLRDENRILIPVDQTAKLISENSKAPVYSFFDIFLGHGIVGGKLVSGYEQGKRAALMVRQILEGMSAKEIPILKQSPNQFMFDSVLLRKHKIKKSNLPAESIIINEKEVFYEKYRNHILATSGAIIVLTLIIIGLLRKLLRKKKLEKRLLEEREGLFKLSIDMLCIIGFDSCFKQLNPSWKKTLGWNQKELKEKPWFAFVHPDDRREAEKASRKLLNNQSLLNFENRYLCKDGTYRWLSWNAFPLKQRKLVFGVARDFTEKKRLTTKMEKLATTDVLTGAKNRRVFFELAQREFSRFKRYSSNLSLLILDIDNFKAINDTYGHQAGDSALKQLVKNINTILRENDVLGRIGGEEFAILLLESTRSESYNIAERIRQITANSIVFWGDYPISFTVSLGLTIFRKENDSLDKAFNRADQAMYRAKEKGKNRVEFLEPEYNLLIQQESIEENRTKW